MNHLLTMSEISPADSPEAGESNKSFSNSMKDLFRPGQGFIATPIIMGLNVLVFIIMAFQGMNVMDPESEFLIRWGSNFTLLTLAGEPWRLLTSCFIHGGIIHLALNMYAFLYIGPVLEKVLGSARFTIVYLACGIAASIASLWWHDMVNSVGASGAIFGMYGVFLALLLTNVVNREEQKDLLASTAAFVGYNLIYGTTSSGIDNAAHIGGLIAGAAIRYGMFLILKYRNGIFRKNLSVIIPSALVMLLASGIFVQLQDGVAEVNKEYARFDKLMEKFMSNQDKAMLIHRLPDSTGAEAYQEKVNESIQLWKENVRITGEVSAMKDIPQDLKERNNELKKYSLLRIKLNETILKAEKENSPELNAEAGKLGSQIDEILEKINKETK